MTERKPEIGDRVLYIPRPGQVRAGQLELCADVVKVNSDGTVELKVSPWNSEDIWQSRVPQQSAAIPGHCWRFKEVALRDSEAIVNKPRKKAASAD